VKRNLKDLNLWNVIGTWINVLVTIAALLLKQQAGTKTTKEQQNGPGKAEDSDTFPGPLYRADGRAPARSSHAQELEGRARTG
jgi:hypothetical protein